MYRAALIAFPLFALLTGMAVSAPTPNTKTKVTFGGLASGHSEVLIPDGYDGMHWDNEFHVCTRRCFKTDAGFQAVVHGRTAAVLDGTPQAGSIRPASGLFSVHSGHFSAFGSDDSCGMFSAYRDGALVGVQYANLWQQDTLVKFDKTFSHIDRFEIVCELSFDNLEISFDESR
jgi:hypothetical protein